MTSHADMQKLIARHLQAEMAGDAEGAVSVYTDDVVHDVVGWPSGPVSGPNAARSFYEQLMAVFVNEDMTPVRTLYGDDFCVVEHLAAGRFPHGFLGAPASEKQVAFRMLHLFEFSDAAISRENVWLDAGAVVAQLAGGDEGH